MAQINLRIDDEIKSNAERTFESIGLSMSTAITIFLKAVIRENGIPFELKAEPLGNRSTTPSVQEVTDKK